MPRLKVSFNTREPWITGERKNDLLRNRYITTAVLGVYRCLLLLFVHKGSRLISDRTTETFNNITSLFCSGSVSKIKTFNFTVGFRRAKVVCVCVCVCVCRYYIVVSVTRRHDAGTKHAKKINEIWNMCGRQHNVFNTVDTRNVKNRNKKIGTFSPYL